MVIIITGPIGVGKTTVCKNVIEILKSAGYACSGILTPKVYTGNEVAGISVIDIRTGKTESLASIRDIYGGPIVGKYFFNPNGIRFGITAIEKGISSDFLLVDEIGHLELGGNGFIKALELIRLGAIKNFILVIRRELLSAYNAQLGVQPYVFETTINNRDELPQDIYSFMKSSLR